MTKTLYWTGVDSSRETRISLFNPASTTSNVTISAFNSSGDLVSGGNVTNSVRVSLAANRGYEQSLTEIFGSGVTGISSVRVQSTRDGVLGLVTVNGTGVSESVPLASRGIAYFVLPSIGGSPRLHLLNPTGPRFRELCDFSVLKARLPGAQRSTWLRWLR